MIKSSVSSSAPRYWLVVPAAGSGQRMGSGIPKQYLSLSKKTLIEQTLERLLELPFIENILLVLNPDDSYWCTLAVSDNPRITRVAGGAERSESVLNALSALANQAHDQDWVLVHDAARPCVRQASVEYLREQLADHPVGGILGIPVSDTLKLIDGEQIVQTIDRRQLWQAQTPQMFRYGLLRECLENALQEGKAVTDEASALEAYGYSPRMIMGRSDNIKVTQPEDLLLAQWILQQQEQQA